MIINFNVDQNEAAFIVKVLASMPTESRVLPLYDKLLAQYTAQVPNTEANTEQNVPEIDSTADTQQANN
jgi:hypothetical protein